MIKKESQRETTTSEDADIKWWADWLMAALHVALEAPHNAEWLQEYREKQDKKGWLSGGKDELSDQL